MNWRCHRWDIETNHESVAQAESRQMALDVKRKVTEEIMNRLGVNEDQLIKGGKLERWDKCFRWDTGVTMVLLPKKEIDLEQRIHIGIHRYTVKIWQLSSFYSGSTCHCWNINIVCFCVFYRSTSSVWADHIFVFSSFCPHSTCHKVHTRTVLVEWETVVISVPALPLTIRLTLASSLSL